ncbi:MAG: hypothetical protein ACAH88_20040, partial [Roseimicrobium sp.]
MRFSLAITLFAFVLADAAQAASPVAPLPVMRENPFYTVTPYALPEEIKLEASGLAVLPDGKLAVSVRKGEVWILDHPEADPKNAKSVGYKLFASGLHEPLGLLWHDGALLSVQRTEVTRMRDTDKDGV